MFRSFKFYFWQKIIRLGFHKALIPQYSSSLKKKSSLLG